MEFTMISALEIGQRGCKMKCRVTRMWDSLNPSMQDALMSVDFILVDAQGTSIQGTMRKEDAPRIRETLSEGNTYIFSNFMVVQPRQKFRACPNQLMIRIGTWTTIRKCFDNGSEFPLYTFHFIDEKEMETRIHTDVHLTDVIGNVIFLGEKEKLYLNGRFVSKRNIDIQTIKIEKIAVTLWGNIADDFDESSLISLPQSKLFIAILSNMTVRAFKAETTLSTTSATKIYINLEIKEVQQFRESLSCPIQITFSESNCKDGALSDFIIPNTSISSLLSIDPILNKGKQYNCQCTITKLDAKKGWWYNACAKCKVGISNYNGLLACKSCGPTANLPIPWYMLTAYVSDHTGEAKFLMFGKHVERLLKVSALQLSQLPNSNRTTIPIVLEQLLEKKYLFTVSVSDKQDNSETLSFNVTKVFDEELSEQEESKKGIEETPVLDTCSIIIPINDGDTPSSSTSDKKRTLDVISELSPLTIKKEKTTTAAGADQQKTSFP